MQVIYKLTYTETDNKSNWNLCPDKSTNTVSIDGQVDNLSCAVDVATPDPGSCHRENPSNLSSSKIAVLKHNKLKGYCIQLNDTPMPGSLLRHTGVRNRGVRNRGVGNRGVGNRGEGERAGREGRERGEAEREGKQESQGKLNTLNLRWVFRVNITSSSSSFQLGRPTELQSTIA